MPPTCTPSCCTSNQLTLTPPPSQYNAHLPQISSLSTPPSFPGTIWQVIIMHSAVFMLCTYVNLNYRLAKLFIAFYDMSILYPDYLFTSYMNSTLIIPGKDNVRMHFQNVSAVLMKIYWDFAHGLPFRNISYSVISIYCF